jgi:hypothetical protein
MSRKLALLIHGCHLQTDGWEDIAWGNPSAGRFGQVARGLQLAARRNVSLIYWGSGASEKDGVKESQYAFDHAVAHASELSEYAGLNRYEVNSWLHQRSFIDVETLNTAEEISRALQVCRERGVDELILVSSPTHIARCMQEAEKAQFESDLAEIQVFATASDTCFRGATPADVVIVEPPHRGDQPRWQTFRYAQSMFSLMRKSEDSFERYLQDWGALLAENGVQISWRPKAP